MEEEGVRPQPGSQASVDEAVKMATLKAPMEVVSQEDMTCLAGAKVAYLLSKRHCLIDGHRKTLESLFVSRFVETWVASLSRLIARLQRQVMA